VFKEYMSSMLGRLVIAGTISLVSVQVASAACLSGDQKLPAGTVNNFVANPSSILGAADLAQTVRDLVASDSSTLSPVLGLLQGASGDQQSAIGSGLGQAASVLCLKTDPNFAAEIQDRVNNSQSAPAKTAYAAITGDDKNRTLATGGSGAGISPGGVGGGTNPAATLGNGTGSTFTFSAESVRGNGLNYFSGGVTGISGVTSTTTTAARTTSP
jgi:hypothetical protein